MGTGAAIGLALDGADLGFLLVELRSDAADLGEAASGENDTLGTALGNGRTAVGDVETVTGTGCVVESGIDGLANGERLAGQQGLVGFEVLGLDETVFLQVSYS